MKNLCKSLYEKYKDIIPYLFFGVCTTVVNIIVYWLLAHPMHIPTMVSTVVAWFVAVLFAYVTNRKWVFNSSVTTAYDIGKEMVSFFACRIATGIVDWACMFIFVDLMHLNDVVIKFIANVIVILLNYIASKMIIFKKK